MPETDSPSAASARRAADSPAPGTPRIYRAGSLATFQGDENGLLSIAVSPNGQLVAGGDSYRTTRVWDVESEKERFVLLAKDPGGVANLAFSPVTGRLLASGGGEEVIRVWDMLTGRLARVFGEDEHGGSINALAITPDDRYVLSASSQDKVRVWDMITGSLVRRLKLTSSNHVLATSGDGKYCVTDSLDGLTVFDLGTGEPTATYSGLVGPVACASNEPLAVTAGGNGTVTLWDLQSGIERQRWKCDLPDSNPKGSAPFAVAFTLDGSQVRAVNTFEVYAWDAQSGRAIWETVTGVYATAAALSQYDEVAATRSAAGSLDQVSVHHIPGVSFKGQAQRSG